MAAAAALALAAVVFAPAVHAATPPWTPQRAVSGEGSDLNLGVKMADGTVIGADVYFPTDPATKQEARGTFPVLLQQTPYGKESIAEGRALAPGPPRT